MLELESPCGKNPMPANLAILFVFAQEDIGLGHVIHFPAALLADEWLLFALSFGTAESLAEFLECRECFHKPSHHNLEFLLSTCRRVPLLRLAHMD